MNYKCNEKQLSENGKVRFLWISHQTSIFWLVMSSTTSVRNAVSVSEILETLTGELTLQFTEVINMKLFLTISLHCRANRYWEYSNLSVRNCFLDLADTKFI